MSIQSRIIGLLAILALGFLILGSGEEPMDPGHWGDGSESTTDRNLQSRGPAPPISRYGYGVVGYPGTYNPPQLYGEREKSYPEQPYSDTYRFRPLTEREQRRKQRGTYPDWYAGRSAMLYRPSPQTQPSPPTPYPLATTDPDPPPEVYSFRPQEKSPGARGRWQSPYDRPDRRFPFPLPPWSSSPYSQWGLTPPSQHRYPNLYRDPDCRSSTC